MNQEQQTAAQFWEARYSQNGRAWSGRANAALEREAANLEPGRALDLGSGEGGDALWLAARGWRVTALDISPTALARGAAAAEEIGLGERIDWLPTDLATWHPVEAYDLVTAHFLHSPVELPREEILRRAATAVASGGVLLIVGHGAFPPWSTHPDDGVALPSPDEVYASLNLNDDDWTVLTSAMLERPVTGPDGEIALLDDAVLTLRRS